MRRKQGTLVPIEQSIIDTAKQLLQSGITEFHGFQIALGIKGMRSLTGYGTLYRALNRLEKMGLLDSRWEDMTTVNENRPRRRYYHLVEGTKGG